MSSPVCPSCQSSHVQLDSLHAESQLVCLDCGCVVEEEEGGCLVTERSVGTTDVRFHQSAAATKQPGRTQIRGLQRVRALCRILRLSYEVEELAEVLFRKAYGHSRFLRARLQTKEALVGCCVLIGCRLRAWPLALGTVCSLLEADPLLVGGVYKDLDRILDLDVPKTCISHVLEAYAREYKLSPVDVPEELAEDAAALASRALVLVELAGEAWLVTGRQPIPLMMAAVFLGWQSLRPSGLRLRYSLQRFCRLAKIAPSRVAVLRVAEMTDVLRTLGREIPWLRPSELATPTQTLQHLDDILQHRHALLRHALQTHARDIQEEEEEQEEKEEQEEETQQDPGVQPCTGASRGDGGGGASQGPAGPRPLAGWAQTMLFAPPCVRKVRRAEAPRDPRERTEVTGDEDISDSEIESYLRSPQEVREYQRAALLLKDRPPH